MQGIDGEKGRAYNSGSHLKLLRGWVKFPTGGIARELSRKLSRSGDDSGADSTVWMREETVQRRIACPAVNDTAPQSEAALGGGNYLREDSLYLSNRGVQ